MSLQQDKFCFLRSLHAWSTAEFSSVLLDELRHLSNDDLPLQQAVTPGCYVDAQTPTYTVLNMTEHPDYLSIKVATQFTEILASCGCGDEPMPQPIYTEMQLRIDRHSARTCIEIVRDLAED